MGSYSDWIVRTRTLITTAVTNAYNNKDAGNDLALAWTAMTDSASTIKHLMPEATGSGSVPTAFHGGSPAATGPQISLFQTWLQANPTQAGYLNMSAEAVSYTHLTLPTILLV